ncbi:CaiC Acyl-CoA synthetases (AMP-forming)/AMP-acid ligases II [Burkholderiaceae bacterium]
MYPSYAQMLRQLAQDQPSAPALTFEGETWTFAQLHERSSQTANALQAGGVGVGDRVALLTKNCAECFELMFACNKIGAILTGLNWRLAPLEIQAIVADAQPKVIVTSPGEAHLLTDATKQLPGVQKVLTLGDEYQAWRGSEGHADPGHEGAPDEVALLLYTSGTTGLPKGVMLTNQGMSFTQRLGVLWGMGPDCVNLVAMPMFHIGGCGYGTSAMTVGGHTILMREVNTSKMVELIAQHRVTHTFLVPTVVQSLLDVPGVMQADLSSFKWLMYGAAPMGDVLLRHAMDMLRCEFIQAYGMTETSGSVVLLPPSDHEPEGPRAKLLQSVGRAVDWVQLRVVNPTTQQDVPTGEVGEIWIQSEMLMSGYWRKPAETAETIQAGGWLRTGDAAYLDDEGYIYLFDRYKDLIISGGENIYPAEVENVLNGHAAVKEVAVMGVPHEKWGETPRAVVVLRPGMTASPAELIAFTRERLAHYKCPSSVVFAEVLPRNASGKLLKRELRLTHAGPAA